MANTYGEFFISVALGNAPSGTLSEEDSRQAYNEIREEMAPAIEASHAQQRCDWKEAHQDQTSF